MTAIEFLTAEQVVEIQQSTLANSGPPNMDKLEGALYRVETMHTYENCDDIYKLAGMYLIAIAKAHAFNDANKRTAFQAASIFLIMNGSELLESSLLVKLTVMAAMDEANLNEIAFSLRLMSDYMNDIMFDYDDEEYMKS